MSNPAKPCQGCQKARLLLRKLGLPVKPLAQQNSPQQPALLAKPPQNRWLHQSTGPLVRPSENPDQPSQ
jgi:hypothetical protein